MQETLNTYLPVILTAVLTYFFTRRQEKTNKIKENKISSIKDFLKSYQGLRLACLSYFYLVEFGVHKDELFNQKAEAVRQARIEFDLQAMILELFIKAEDEKIIKHISDRLEEARIGVAFYIIQTKSDLTLRPDAKIKETDEKFQAVNPILNEELPAKIKELGKNFRIDFGVESSPQWKQAGMFMLVLFLALLVQYLFKWYNFI